MTNPPQIHPIPLWLDCDPGHDDAFAILLAAHHPSLRLLGISTVHGNASLERCTANASRVLQAIGRADIPVYPGAARPFCRSAIAAPNIHGVSGLDGTDLLPDARTPPITRTPCLLALRTSLLSQPPNTAWLVATGALTNVALLFAAFPEVGAHIAGLSIMGGAVGGGFTHAQLGHVEGRENGERIGNVTRWAEFNIYCDPESAHAIFSSPVLAAKTTLIPLDLTHLVLGTESVQQTLLHGSGPPSPAPPSTLRRMLYELLMFFAKTYAHVFGITAGPPLHDPLAVAVVLDLMGREELGFRTGVQRWVVDVVTEGRHTKEEGERGEVGRTVVTRVDGGREGVEIPRGVDVQAFWRVLEGCVVRAEEALGGTTRSLAGTT
ncbi:Uridine nucleosidase 1 [Lambiella insularis]|nr:Uridine nucleosidase 1 [Lambiella insularis]